MNLKMASSSSARLRIGYVPEHFSTPLFFAQKYFGLDGELIPFPSGTGHMVTSLRSKEIDIGIGLTEGWIAGLGNEKDEEKEKSYRIIGTYVESPLCWAISAGSSTSIKSVDDLENKRCGVSRIGSGSYVMSYVLAQQQGWLSTSSTSPPFDFKPLQTFANLRTAVNTSEADFFMWEHFTSKKYYDNGEIKRIGEIYTPWPSWMIVGSTDLLSFPPLLSSLSSVETKNSDIKQLLEKINHGVKYFLEHQDEAVEYISTNLDYSKEDATAWLSTVKFSESVHRVDTKVVGGCIQVLQQAGVLTEGQRMKAEHMIVNSSRLVGP